MVQPFAVLLLLGLALTAAPALAGGDKHQGQIDVSSVSGGATQAQQGSLADGRYTITVVSHAASGLGSLRSLGSTNDLFANSRGGDQGAPVPRGPSGTGKTMSADLLGKSDGGSQGDGAALAQGGGQPPTQAMGDGSVRFLRDSISTTPTAKPGGGVPTGTVTFKVDGVSPAGGGGAKGPATLRR